MRLKYETFAYATMKQRPHIRALSAGFHISSRFIVAYANVSHMEDDENLI